MSESRGERRQSLGESRDEPPMSDLRAEDIHPIVDLYTARSSCPALLAFSAPSCFTPLVITLRACRCDPVTLSVLCFVLDTSRDRHPPPSELLAVAAWSRALHVVF
jgi:hypothetical protein